MPVSNAPSGADKSLFAFVGFGSDTDCDGTSYFICGVFARDFKHADEVLKEDFGGMTYEGINEIVSGEVARQRGVNVDKLMARTSESFNWSDKLNDWICETVPFRYATSLYGDTDNILS
jgi:hypothetical protein